MMGLQPTVGERSACEEDPTMTFVSELAADVLSEFRTRIRGDVCDLEVQRQRTDAIQAFLNHRAC
jgi:hypothetical protein